MYELRMFTQLANREPGTKNVALLRRTGRVHAALPRAPGRSRVERLRDLLDFQNVNATTVPGGLHEHEDRFAGS